MKVINQNIHIDGIDKKILRTLMEDARTPILEIARNVGISGAAIHQRLRKLESSDLISGSKLNDELSQVQKIFDSPNDNSISLKTWLESVSQTCE